MTRGESTSRKLNYDNARIAYTIAGEQERETIVMLHPAFADRHIFEPQIAAFSSQYRVIAVDLPGHGDTLTKDSRVTMKDAPDIVKSILSEHGIADCHVIGVSMGSLVAQAFADRYPNLTRTVTVVGGYSIHRPTDKINKAQRKEMFRWLLYILFSMKKFRSYLISVSCYTPQGRKLFERGAVRFGRKSFSAMSGMNRLFHRNEGVVPYPLFIIVGEHDLPLAHEAAQEWHAAEPNSDYAVVPHAGHCANADRPEVFNEWVLGFIRDGASGSPDASFRLPL